MGLVTVLASFLGGDGDLRGISFGEVGRELNGGCFLLETTSEKSFEGAGGEPHTEVISGVVFEVGVDLKEG